MKYDGWQKIKGCEGKLTHYWNTYRRGEPIPEDMILGCESSCSESSCSESSDGGCCSQGDCKAIFDWIDRKNGPIPKSLKYPGWQTERYFGRTPLHEWIEHRSDDIPEEMKYPGWERDKNERGWIPLL